MSTKKEKLSVIVPCFNEQEALPFFYEKTVPVLKKMSVSYELLFVDDGSKDKTLAVLEELAGKDRNVRYFSFSRNFGKEAAMYCGLQNAEGDYVVVMDADLQHSPLLLPTMLKEIKGNGYDSAAVRRTERKEDGSSRRLASNLFNSLMNKMSDVEMVPGQMDFRMMNRKMVDSVLRISEYNRFTKGIFSWVGFNTYWIEAEDEKRVAGESKWNVVSLMRYSFDGILSFSDAPLNMVIIIGSFVTLIGFIYLLYIVIKYLLVGDPVQGWATIMSVMIIIGGVQQTSIGVIGKYVGKTYLETKNRPIYILNKTNKKEK